MKLITSILATIFVISNASAMDVGRLDTSAPSSIVLTNDKCKTNQLESMLQARIDYVGAKTVKGCYFIANGNVALFFSDGISRTISLNQFKMTDEARAQLAKPAGPAEEKSRITIKITQFKEISM